MYPTIEKHSVVEAYYYCTKILEKISVAKGANNHKLRDPVANKVKRLSVEMGEQGCTLSDHYLRHIRKFIHYAIDEGVLSDLDVKRIKDNIRQKKKRLKDEQLSKEAAEIISTLLNKSKGLISKKKFNVGELDRLNKKLKGIGYSYKAKKHPKFEVDKVCKTKSGMVPTSLAEVFVWKLGRWQAFKKFESMCLDSEISPSESQVVIYALSKYLTEDGAPIFDQHVLRAMRYIDPSLSDQDKNKIDRALQTKTVNWSRLMSGKTVNDCYKLYVKFVSAVQKESGIELAQLDSFLMPLGEAIKKHFKSENDILSLDD